MTDAPTGTTSDPGGMVDWDLAVRIGSRLAGEGPSVEPHVAREAVAELRAGAERSTGLVREFTGLAAAERTAPVLVVDRAGWVQANADGFREVLSPVIARLGKDTTSALTRAVGSRITGAEVGGLLGFMGGKVLGQFDPFFAPSGRLLLVAPNIVHVEREIEADPADFRLWVCLHEETHRVQFTAVPWMRDWMFEQLGEVAGQLESSTLEDGLSRLTEALRDGVRGGARGGVRGGSLLDLFGSPAQRALVERLTGVMSLLEGHADVVMDGVGPEVIASVDAIRRSFNVRRQGVGVLDRILRRLLGLEAKMAQYRDGAAFVRAVVDEVGMADFNAVWAGPENLPSKAEIADPHAWMSRVLAS